MDCIQPVLLKDKGHVPCGKCVACLQRRTNDWVVRLSQEYYDSTACHFVTLTYDDTHVPRQFIKGAGFVKLLSRRDVQLFLKRFRKRLAPARIRYFACGEYGTTTFRPHYHLIIFNSPTSDIYSYVKESWSLGFISISQIVPAHFAYVAKYCSSYQFLPEHLRDRSRRPFVLCSRHPAIGSGYLRDSIVDYHRQTLSTQITGRDGVKRALPKYYRDRIFDDQMRADIAERTTEYRNSQTESYINKYGARDTANFGEPTMHQQQREDFLRRTSKLYKDNKRKL